MIPQDNLASTIMESFYIDLRTYGKEVNIGGDISVIDAKRE